jgi:hypothetical protein
VRIRDRAQLPLAQLGQLGVLLPVQVQLDELLGRRPARGLQERDLVVDAHRLGDVFQLAFGQLGALVEVVDALRFGGRGLDPLPVEAIQLLEPARVVVDAFEQLGGLGMTRDRGQRPAQRRDRILDVARLLAAARELIVDGGGPVGAVRADPVRVGVEAGQQLQGLLVARADADDLGQPLRRRVQLLQLLAQHPAQTQQQVGAPAGVLGPFQLQLVQADDRAVVAQRPVDLAGRLDRPDVLLGQLAARALRVADRAFPDARNG